MWTGRSWFIRSGRLYGSYSAMATRGVSTDVSQRLEKAVSDTFGRRHTYLRLSLTDKCNMRCQYCMPPGIYGEHDEEIRYLGRGLGWLLD